MDGMDQTDQTNQIDGMGQTDPMEGMDQTVQTEPMGLALGSDS